MLFKKQISNQLKSKTDILITSGAVSKGKFDFIPSVINQFKLKNHFNLFEDNYNGIVICV